MPEMNYASFDTGEGVGGGSPNQYTNIFPQRIDRWGCSKNTKHFDLTAVPIPTPPAAAKKAVLQLLGRPFSIHPNIYSAIRRAGLKPQWVTLN